MWNKNFICVIIANFLLSVSHASINPLVSSYTKYLHATAEFAGFLVGMFFLVSFMMHPFVGIAMAKIDKRRLLIFVFAIGCVANLGYAMLHSISAFMLFRFLSGIQYSMVGALTMVIAADNLPPAKLASGLGVFGVGGVIGTAIAPSIGIALLDFGILHRGEALGFTLAFLFSAIALAMAILPSAIVDSDNMTKEDRAGAGAWYKNIFTVHALPYALLIMLVLIPYGMMNAYMVEYGKELGISGIPVFYAVLAGGLAVSRPMCGFLTDTFGIDKVMVPALALYAIAMLLIGWSTSLKWLLVGAVSAAIGFGTAQPTIQAMSMQIESPLRRSVAGNTIYMGLDLGFFLGPFIGGLVYARSDYAVVFRTSAVFICFTIIFFVVFLPMYKRRRDAVLTWTADKFEL
jgi:MFS family permease